MKVAVAILVCVVIQQGMCLRFDSSLLEELETTQQPLDIDTF